MTRNSIPISDGQMKGRNGYSRLREVTVYSGPNERVEIEGSARREKTGAAYFRFNMPEEAADVGRAICDVAGQYVIWTLPTESVRAWLHEELGYDNFMISETEMRAIADAYSEALAYLISKCDFDFRDVAERVLGDRIKDAPGVE